MSSHPQGCPVAHKIYGIPQTINSANYVYFKAYQELFALRSGTGLEEPQSSDVSEQRLIPFQELDRIVTGMRPHTVSVTSEATLTST